MIKQVCKQIHLWLSVPFGLIVTLICLSGAILIFERDFGHIGQAEVVSNGREPLQLDSILKSTEAYLAGSNQIVGITTYPDTEHAYKVMLAKPAMAALWVDQYTGNVIGKYERAEIFKLASSAHRRLFGKSKAEGAFGAKTGKLIIGITTICLLLIIISGLIVWWPKKGQYKNKFKISTDKGFFRFWFDFHCVGGVISSIVLVICIVTGLNWSFGWYRKAFYATLGTEVAKSSTHKTPAENFPAWEIAYNNIKNVNQNTEIRMYQGEADVMAGGYGNQQAGKTYRFDSEDGRITAIIPYSEKSQSNHIKGWIYTLHVGSWSGWLSKTIYLLCVIMGAILPITGYYLWIKRLMIKRKHHVS
ncbi:MAG: PepSY domain-containing protein [Muribaculaceae bacterium]|nr:PepSY domain-containing protein [Muribaculaceae bacterium]